MTPDELPDPLWRELREIRKEMHDFRREITMAISGNQQFGVDGIVQQIEKLEREMQGVPDAVARINRLYGIRDNVFAILGPILVLGILSAIGWATVLILANKQAAG